MNDDDTDLMCKSIIHKPAKVLPDKQDAMIIYSSGTTGAPKGVVHTHGSLEAMMTAMQEEWQWTENDHVLNILPLHHVHGIMNVLNTSLWSGAQCRLIPKYDGRGIWDVLLDDKDGVDINVFMAVPAIYNRLIAYYEENNMNQNDKEVKRALKQIRLMVSGSSALPNRSFDKWREITGHTLLERYGATEIGMALTNSYKSVQERRAGHVGFPFPKVETAFLDIDTNEFNDPGLVDNCELLIRSP